MKLKRETNDDGSLFREAMRGVKPLVRDHKGVTPARRARFVRESPPSELDEPVAGDDLRFHRPGVQNSVLRRLRRGHYPVQAELDLHGLRVTEAERALREFLAAALHGHIRCVRVIHGKGLKSGRGPVLRPAVASLLRRTRDVVAYVSAGEEYGGTGALHVLLKER